MTGRCPRQARSPSPTMPLATPTCWRCSTAPSPRHRWGTDALRRSPFRRNKACRSAAPSALRRRRDPRTRMDVRRHAKGWPCLRAHGAGAGGRRARLFPHRRASSGHERPVRPSRCAARLQRDLLVERHALFENLAARAPRHPGARRRRRLPLATRIYRGDITMPFYTLPAIDPEIELAPQDLGRATLRHAAQLLRERGHVKKALIDHRGSLCFYGAILMAAHEDCFADVNNVHNATTTDA